MKIRLTVGMILLALVFGAPQLPAQIKRAEKKLKKEMRKLEKQMKKVKELQKENYVPLIEEFEIQNYRGFEDLDDQFRMQWELTEAERKRVQEEVKRAQQQIKQHQLENMKHFKEQQKQVQEEVRRALELQRDELEKIRDHYPDGFYFKDLEIPEIEFELPEWDLDAPRLLYKFPDHQNFRYHGQPMIMSGFDSDNHLSINAKLDAESVDKNYDFTVSDEASFLEIKAAGSLKEGKVSIRILTPDKKEYHKMELSQAADVNWNQRIDLAGEDKQNLKGKWTVEVKGSGASGLYQIHLRSK